MIAYEIKVVVGESFLQARRERFVVLVRFSASGPAAPSPLPDTTPLLQNSESSALLPLRPFAEELTAAPRLLHNAWKLCLGSGDSGEELMPCYPVGSE